MMHLIADQQLEGIAPGGHQIARRVIGGDGQWQDLLLAAIIDAHVRREGVDQPGVPLVEQIDRRGDHQRRAVHAADRLNGHEGLARARGQHDAPAPPRLLPGRQRFELIGIRLARLLQRQI